jgi:hypothetical protein
VSKVSKTKERFHPKRIRLAGLMVLLLLSGVAQADRISNKWRLEFSGGAHSNGVIVLRVTPFGGEPLMVEAQIAKGTSENMVAEAVVEALRLALPEAQFSVERDDGEDVLIKKRRKAADFLVEIVSNSVEHVRINPDRE